MPVTTPVERVDSYGGDHEHFVHVLDVLFEPAIRSAGFEPVRPTAQGADLIHAEIVRNLEMADLVLCDISGANPNVFFELGIRTALDRPICMVRDHLTTSIPFDTGGLNFHTYSARLASWELDDEVARLTKHLTVTVERSNGRNALWRHFGLTQRGTEAILAGAEPPEGAAMAVLLEEIRDLRSTVEERERVHGGFASPSTDGATRSAWQDLIAREAEPLGSDVVAFASKAQEVAANDGVRLAVSGAGDDTILLRATTGKLTTRGRSLIDALARAYGVAVSFDPAQ
jgi:hypothetical protein